MLAERLVSRLTIAGAILLSAGTTIFAGTLVYDTLGPAYADSSPVELFCANTPLGNIVSNDVVISGALSPSQPASGQQFQLTGFQAEVPISGDVLKDAAEVGNNSLSGTVEGQLEVSGASPSSMSTGSLAFDTTIPNPVPSSGVTIDEPSTPATFGPFTATGPNVSVSLGQSTTISFDDAGNPLDFACSWYPNYSLPQSGITQATPPGLPISPEIAFAGSGGANPPPSIAPTGPYELYCPGTPVGSLALNDVVTTASISPSALSAGDQFDVTSYETQVPIPAGIAAGLAGFGNTQLEGFGATTIEAFGASPASVSTGLESFDVQLPDPSSGSGVTLDIPSTSTTIGPFTADGGPITVAGEQTTLMVAAISQHVVKLSCQAYPNDTVTPSGVVTTKPVGTPILPVIATSSASGTPTTPTTPTTPPGQLTGSYELYCPGSPIGDVVLNDTTSSAAISPSAPEEGSTFDVTNYQSQITVPQALLQLFEGVGINSISGFIAPSVTATGAIPEDSVDGYSGSSPPVAVVEGTATGSSSVGSVTATTSPAGGAVSVPPVPTTVPPVPSYSPGLFQFTVDLPNPVPPAGVTFDVPSPGGDTGLSFVALGGPISVEQQGLSLFFQAGNGYFLNCLSYPNETEPEGVTTTPPTAPGSSVLIASGEAPVGPPPASSAQPGPFEEYCPGSPIGNLVLNDATISASLSPAVPSSGQQFQVVGYQTSVPVPQSIVAAAQALGATSITGTASGTLALSGATQASVPTGSMAIDVAIPQSIPSSGVTLEVPASPTSFGPFTANGSTVTVMDSPVSVFNLDIGGISLSLTCLAYPNDSAPTGTSFAPPSASPVWPLVATSSSTTSVAGGSSDPASAQDPASGGDGSDPPTSDTQGTTASTTAQAATGSPATAGTGSGGGTPSAGGSVSAASGSLAFTGAGAGFARILLAGVLLVLVGLAMVLVARPPKLFCRRLRWQEFRQN